MDLLTVWRPHTVQPSVASFADRKHEKYKQKVVSMLVLACRGRA